MTNQKNYQAFISYRRGGGTVLADLVHEKLEKMGTATFFDKNQDLDGTIFFQTLSREIKNAPVFVLILSHECFSRPWNSTEKDWFYEEILCAAQNHKPIIPFSSIGFRWSNNDPPKCLSWLKKICYLEYTESHQDLPFEKLNNFILAPKKLDYTEIDKIIARSASHGTPPLPGSGTCPDSDRNQSMGVGKTTSSDPNSEKKQTSGPKPKLPTSKETHTPGERMVRTIEGVEYAFRWCPAGDFFMGGGTKEWEKPKHKVSHTVGFWILETMVTQKMWRSVVGSRTSVSRSEDSRPVTGVSWNECCDFCQKLSQKGLNTQLPTEAQWEYACQSNIPDMLNGIGEWCFDWFGEYYYSKSSYENPIGPEFGQYRVVRGATGNSQSTTRDSSEPSTHAPKRGFRVVFLP